jgi:hypothetical protein
VDAIATDGTQFHAYWWTPYVTFCALAVVYVWEIQQVQTSQYDSYGLHDLLELAEKCQNHLARATAPDSPSHRYSIILEELRQEAKNQTIRAPWRGERPVDEDDTPTANDAAMHDASLDSARVVPDHYADTSQGIGLGQEHFGGTEFYGSGLLETWETTDWLDLDSSVSAHPRLDQCPSDLLMLCRLLGLSLASTVLQPECGCRRLFDHPVLNIAAGNTCEYRRYLKSYIHY